MGAGEGREDVLTSHFRRGFASELIKISAFAQQHADQEAYNSSGAMSQIMSQTQGSESRTGLKSGNPLMTATSTKKRAPTPLTTPMDMVGYSGGGTA